MNDSENKKEFGNEKKFGNTDFSHDEKKVAAALEELDAEMEKLAGNANYKPMTMTPEDIMREAQAMYSYATEFSQYEAAFAQMESWMDDMDKDEESEAIGASSAAGEAGTTGAAGTTGVTSGAAGIAGVTSTTDLASGKGEPNEFRIEHDTMGDVKVPADKYWGAQTQRSFMNFQIGEEKMPHDIIKAFGILKKAAALANMELGMLDAERGNIIDLVCDEVITGRLDGNFPLAVWQTGSGTQTNMNVNEVIANRAKEFAPEGLDIHPNNHVNCSQSSNDTFPTAMHIAALLSIETKLIPSIDRLIDTFDMLSARYADIIKTGRTHLQDATPLTLGQEISGWAQMLKKDKEFIITASDSLRELALGGTAVGTGLNAHEAFGAVAAEIISALTGTRFVTAPNKFHSLTSKDQTVFVHGAMKALAADMMKIANDVRWLASGPRCGLGELKIPENEPGSSIMPGKVNPTQCEAVTMVAVQVMGNDATIGFAASQGNFQLNLFMPVIIYNFLQSVHLLSDSIDSFNKNCASGIEPNREKIAENLRKSLMLVTALNPHIGYENAAVIAKKAHAEGTSLKEAAVSSGLLTEEEFDEYVRPEKMVGPKHG